MCLTVCASLVRYEKLTEPLAASGRQDSRSVRDRLEGTQTSAMEDERLPDGQANR
jgi:hypothetical protein